MREVATSDFFASLRRAISNVHLYPKGHPQNEVAIDMLTETSGALTAGFDQVVLSMMDNAFYLDRQLLPQASLEYRDVYRLLHGRGLDSISIVGRPTVGDLAELADFLQWVNTIDTQGWPPNDAG